MIPLAKRPPAMKTITQLALALFIFVFVSCTKPKETTTDNKSDTLGASEVIENEQMTEVTRDQNRIQLKGIYATSTQIPDTQFGYAKLFDGDNNTYWSTMPGAGPDEGIMLYFQSPQSISSLEITQPVSENLSIIKTVTVYINGNPTDELRISNSKAVLNASDVRSLFIRISDVEDLSEQQAEGITVRSFPNSSSIGITEIKIFSGDHELSVELPEQVAGTMTASSTLAPVISYGIRNLFDSRKEFVWVEGAKSNGENESLNFKFNEPQTISGLKIMNGFQRSDKHFSANERVKALTISNEANESAEVQLTDTQGEQEQRLSAPLKAKDITIKIKEIYPGTTYKDLVISELKFISGNSDFIIKDNTADAIKNDLLAKAKGTPLEKIIDTRIYNELIEMDSYKRSLILRSDYTFVAYSEESSEQSAGSDLNEVIADGNWEIKEISPDVVKVRLFGKLFRLSETSDYYKGDSSSEYLQIFQDNVLIQNSTVSGEKFIQALLLPPDDN
jgi:hypothetical protein